MQLVGYLSSLHVHLNDIAIAGPDGSSKKGETFFLLCLCLKLITPCLKNEELSMDLEHHVISAVLEWKA